jgi:polyisoprenoid-binding protein YceI
MSRIHSIIRTIVLINLFVGAVNAGEIYKIDNARSTIAFKVHQFVSVTNGRFKQFSATIDVEGEHPEKSSVTARIQVNSIDTGIAKRDQHLLSADFFNAEKFPEIIFKSRNVRQTGPQMGDIEGDFTMHGVTRPIVLHVKLVTPTAAGNLPPRSHWEVTTAPLKRRDFDLMFGSTTETVSGIAQDVSVTIDIEASKAP